MDEDDDLDAACPLSDTTLPNLYAVMNY